jgi:hypothetical protein
MTQFDSARNGVCIPLEQGKNSTVLHPQPAHACAESANAKPPAAEKLVLVLSYIFIEKDHALRDLRGEG